MWSGDSGIMIALVGYVGAALSASCELESVGISSDVTAVCLLASTQEWRHAFWIAVCSTLRCVCTLDCCFVVI